MVDSRVAINRTDLADSPILVVIQRNIDLPSPACPAASVPGLVRSLWSTFPPNVSTFYEQFTPAGGIFHTSRGGG